MFELWDEDSLKEDEFIGYFLIPIASIGDSKVAVNKYKLGQRSSEKSQGAVYVSYLFTGVYGPCCIVKVCYFKIH